MNMSCKKEKGFHVYGRRSNGTVSPAVYVAKDALLIDLKKSFEEWSTITPSQQSLTFNGMHLDDDARSLESYMIRPLSTVQLQERPHGVYTMNIPHSYNDILDRTTTHKYKPIPPPCGPSDQGRFGRQCTIDDRPQSLTSAMVEHLLPVRLQERPLGAFTTSLAHSYPDYTSLAHSYPDCMDRITPLEYNPTPVQVPRAVTPLQCGPLISNHSNSDPQCTIDDRELSLNSTMFGHMSPGGIIIRVTEYVEVQPSYQDSQSYLSKFFDFITGLFSHDPYERGIDYSYWKSSTPQGSGGTYLNNHAPSTYS